jgi:hypothetical protein
MFHQVYERFFNAFNNYNKLILILTDFSMATKNMCFK